MRSSSKGRARPATRAGPIDLHRHRGRCRRDLSRSSAVQHRNVESSAGRKSQVVRHSFQITRSVQSRQPLHRHARVCMHDGLFGIFEHINRTPISAGRKKRGWTLWRDRVCNRFGSRSLPLALRGRPCVRTIATVLGPAISIRDGDTIRGSVDLLDQIVGSGNTRERLTAPADQGWRMAATSRNAAKAGFRGGDESRNFESPANGVDADRVRAGGSGCLPNLLATRSSVVSNNAVEERW